MALATLVKGRRYLDYDTHGIAPNFYVIFSGTSTTPRKSTGIALTRDLIEEVHPERVGPTNFTFPALLDFMLKKTHPEDPTNSSTRTRLTCFIDEFSTLINVNSRGSTCTIFDELNTLYGGGDILNVRRVKGEVNIVQPRVSIMGAATYSLLREHFTHRDWTSGFLARCLFVTPQSVATQSYPGHAPPPQPALFNVLKVRAQDLVLNLGKGLAPGGRYPMRLSPAADAALQKNERALKDWGEKFAAFVGGEDDPVGSYIQRFHTNVMKLAMLYEIDEDPLSLEVQEDSVEAAIDIGYKLLLSFSEVFMQTTITIHRVQTRIENLLAHVPERRLKSSDLYSRLEPQERRVYHLAIQNIKASYRIRVVPSPQGTFIQLD